MAPRKKPSLTDILAQFKEAQQKTASGDADSPEMEAVAPVEAVDVVVEDTATTSEDVAEAAAAVEDAEADVVDAKETLKAVADEFINEHTAALKKEAQLFGELFAVACLEHMNKTASIMDLEQQVYERVMNDITSASVQQKCASVYDESYLSVMAQLSGFNSAEELRKVANEQGLTSDDIASLIAAQAQAQDEATPEELSEEDLAAMDQMVADGGDEEAPEQEPSPVAEALESAADAAESNAEAIKAIAEAAQLLTGVEEPESVGDEGTGEAMLGAANMLGTESAGEDQLQEQALAELGG